MVSESKLVLLILFFAFVGVANCFELSFLVQCFAGGELFTDTLFIGLDSSATNGYDPAFDLSAPPPPPPPVTLYAYFPLEDPGFPFIRRLRRDFRNARSAVICWKMIVESYGYDSLRVNWDSTRVSEILPAHLWIGKSLVSVFPSLLFDCSTAGSISLFNWEELTIVYTSGLSDSLFGVVNGRFVGTSAESVKVFAYSPELPFHPDFVPHLIAGGTAGFEFRLPPRDYVLVYKNGTTKTSIDRADLVGSTFIRLLPGDTVNLSLRVPTNEGNTYQLHGRVVDTDGLPVRYALVFAEGARINRPNPISRMAIADSMGNFTISDLNNTGVILWAYQAGFIPSYFPGRFHWAEAETIYPASDTGFIEIRLRRLGVDGAFGVYGKLVGPMGLSEPVTGARVYAVNESGDTTSCVISTFAGEFVMKNLPGGRYNVCIDAYRFNPVCIEGVVTLGDSLPFYNLGILSLSRATVVEEVTAGEDFGVKIYPNPFNESVRIEFEYAPCGKSLYIFDILGRECRRIILNGERVYIWDGKDQYGRVVSSGVYFLRFEKKVIGKMVFVR